MSMTTHQAQTLGAVISHARQARGRSMGQLARDIGVNKSWISRIERGAMASPDAGALMRLGRTLDIEANVHQATGGDVVHRLPTVDVYLRAKYDLRPSDIARIEDYINELRSDA